ncbi:tetratricopeptide repeat protein [Coraliomargarita parva]|uniref:tetratricopeptide repeat protein n=1 Tax=Coraliomargarita parva TaxID=3014050 RepID=UPI0022B50EDA|nr:tetratricopeptide repeat protein [Coraliomargarita parva]
MHRPKKKKIHNPTLPDDQQDVVDERHLIDTEDSVDISLEDRLRLYWMENKGFISGCVTVIALLIIAFQGMRIYKEKAIANMQASFMSAKADDSLDSFAQKYANKELGGFAALMVADQAFEDKDYARATEYYDLAQSALEGSTLAGRAKIGSAFAIYQGGDTAAGLAALTAVADAPSLSEAIRAEAAYHLAVEADVAGQTEIYDGYVQQINAFTSATGWQQRLRYYEQTAH